MAQDDEESKKQIRPVAISVKVTQLDLMELNLLSAFPGNVIGFSINTNYFRLEPLIGFASQKSEVDGESMEARASRIGLGAYGITRKNRLNYLYGLKVESINGTNEYRYAGEYEKYDTKIYSWGPDFGAEYMLSDRFSIAGMAGIFHLKVTDGSTYSEDEESTGWRSETSIAVRFYF